MKAKIVIFFHVIVSSLLCEFLLYSISSMKVPLQLFCVFYKHTVGQSIESNMLFYSMPCGNILECAKKRTISNAPYDVSREVVG